MDQYPAQTKSAAPVYAERLAALTLFTIVVLLAANGLFNAAMRAWGYDYPYATFLFDPDDLYADYFKLILSYPGGKSVHVGNLMGLHRLIEFYALNTDYSGTAALAGVRLTHFLLPPFTTMFCLLNVAAMRVVDPIALFVAINLALLTYWCVIAVRFAGSRAEARAWIVTGVASYPVLMMIDRGNVYAGLTGLLLVHHLLLLFRRRSPILAAALLGVAICMRPNAALVVLPMLALPSGHRAKMLAVVSLVAVAFSGASLAVAHAIYPPYTPAVFSAGLRFYYDQYVIGDHGLAYGSSLYGGLKLLFGYRPGLDTLAAAVALAVWLAAYWLALKRRIRRSRIIFLACAAYSLGTSVFGDYHLILFLTAPMLLAAEGRPLGESGAAILAASCLLLAPKNYAFADGASWQVVINPLVLLAAALFVITREAVATPTRSRGTEGRSFFPQAAR